MLVAFKIPKDIKGLPQARQRDMLQYVSLSGMPGWEGVAAFRASESAVPMYYSWHNWVARAKLMGRLLLAIELAPKRLLVWVSVIDVCP
jgi:hypothetical protein